jgi:hypothetical protein
MAVRGAGTEDVLVEARHEPHGGAGLRSGQLVQVLGQDVDTVAVHLDLGEPVAERAEPCPQPSLVGGRAKPGVQRPQARRRVRAEVRGDGDGRSLVAIRHAAPA